MSTVEVTITGMAVGGDGVGRDDQERVIFVRGALPGERVVAEVTTAKSSFAKATLAQVLTPADERREPPCPHVARGCGGCGWQHIAHDAQRTHKVDILRDALTRIGRIVDPEVRLGVALDPTGHRTTLRTSVVSGALGFRRRRAHEVVEVDSCLVAHPGLADLIVAGRYEGAHEVTLRIGARTGERLVLASPSAAQVVVPSDVTVVGADELAAGRRAWYHEIVADRRWRVSATSFFQARPDGAEAIIDAIVDGLDASSGRLVDLCCGVGLLGGAVVARHPGRWRLVGVERHRSAVVDARHNLADLDDVQLVRASMAAWRPDAADAVIADPSRAGLGRVGVEKVAATGARRVVLVSCDPGSLGRDAALLVAQGYRFEGAVAVDLFPHTPHIEAVSTFVR